MAKKSSTATVVSWIVRGVLLLVALALEFGRLVSGLAEGMLFCEGGLAVGAVLRELRMVVVSSVDGRGEVR